MRMCGLAGYCLAISRTDGSVSLYYLRGHINDCISEGGWEKNLLSSSEGRKEEPRSLEGGEAMRILSGAYKCLMEIAIDFSILQV